MRLLSLLACFIFSLANAQNIIPNPSFEDENICELGIPCSPSGWYSVSNMPYGYENKLTHHITGNRAISFLISLKQEARTYWQAPLLSDLKQGEKYLLHFYIYSPAKKITPEYFGIYFSNTFFRSPRDGILQPPQWVNISGAFIHSLNNDWQEINLEFKATEDAKFMLMGNFSIISNQDILKAVGKKAEVLEYYIDDLSLTAVQPLTTDEQLNVKKRSNSLYLSNFRHKFLEKPIPVTDSLPEHKTVFTLKPDTLLLGKINFRFDSYELLNKQMIRNYFDAFKSNSISRITITGYTDSVGNNSYNIVLSENRAISVKKYLVDSLRIPGNIIVVEGKGKTNDQKLQADNRRVELLIYRKD